MSPVDGSVSFAEWVPRAEYDAACVTLAQMHAAAVGEVRGPIRGVVEDVADVRAQRDAALLVVAGVRAALRRFDGPPAAEPVLPGERAVVEAAVAWRAMVAATGEWGIRIEGGALADAVDALLPGEETFGRSDVTCGTCGGEGVVACAAHVAGCVDMERACPDCRLAPATREPGGVDGSTRLDPVIEEAAQAARLAGFEQRGDGPPRARWDQLHPTERAWYRAMVRAAVPVIERAAFRAAAELPLPHGGGFVDESQRRSEENGANRLRQAIRDRAGRGGGDHA